MINLTSIEDLNNCQDSEAVVVLLPETSPALFQRMENEAGKLCWYTPGMETELSSEDLMMMAELHGVKNPCFLLVLQFRPGE